MTLFFLYLPPYFELPYVLLSRASVCPTGLWAVMHCFYAGALFTDGKVWEQEEKVFWLSLSLVVGLCLGWGVHKHFSHSIAFLWSCPLHLSLAPEFPINFLEGLTHLFNVFNSLRWHRKARRGRSGRNALPPARIKHWQNLSSFKFFFVRRKLLAHFAVMSPPTASATRGSFSDLHSRNLVGSLEEKVKKSYGLF